MYLPAGGGSPPNISRSGGRHLHRCSHRVAAGKGERDWQRKERGGSQRQTLGALVKARVLRQRACLGTDTPVAGFEVSFPGHVGHGTPSLLCGELFSEAPLKVSPTTTEQSAHVSTPGSIGE